MKLPKQCAQNKLALINKAQAQLCVMNWLDQPHKSQALTTIT